METTPFILFVIVDVLGIAGAVLVAIPFLREHKLKELLHVLRREAPIPGLSRTEEIAEDTVQKELARFKPGDGAYVGWGLVIIGLSYGLHIVAEFLEYFGKH